jgi:hypothetical protein
MMRVYEYGPEDGDQPEICQGPNEATAKGHEGCQ